jgi:hypothetical protein
MSDLVDRLIQLTKAVNRAAEEHGRPNTFGFRELEEYGGPPAMVAANAARRYPQHLAAQANAFVNEERRVEVRAESR